MTVTATPTKTCPRCAEEVKPAAVVCRFCGYNFEQSAAQQLRPRRLDWFSILTFVLAVLWVFGLGSLLALYVGRQSLRRMHAQEEFRGRTVAWAGVALAVFGVAMSVLWVGLSIAA
jgi:hypothetical protein